MATQKQLIQKGINVYKKGLVETLKYEIKQQLEYIKSSKKYLKELEMDLKIVKSPKTSTKKRRAMRKHGYTSGNQKYAIDHIKIDIVSEAKSLKRYTNKKREKKEALDCFNSISIIEKDIEKLKGKEHPFVIGVEYNSYTLSFYTVPLKVKLKGGIKYHNIGHFQININIKGSFNIRIVNLGFSNRSYPHWCVKGTRPCFGEWTTGIYNYLKQGQIYLTIDSVIRFLTTPVNTGYMNAGEWIRGNR